MNCGLKCNIHEYTPCSVVHVEVIQFISWTSVIHFVRSSRLSPCEVLMLETYENYVAFSASSFSISEFPEFLDATGFACHFFLVTAPGFRFRKFPQLLTYLSRQVSPLLQPSNRQGMHLAASLENSTLHRILIFFCLVSLNLWVSRGLMMQSDLSRMRNLPKQLKTGSLLWALILPQSCLLLPQVFTNILRGLRTAGRAFVGLLLWRNWRVSASSNCCMLKVQSFACLFCIFKVTALIQWSFCTLGV